MIRKLFKWNLVIISLLSVFLFNSCEKDWPTDPSNVNRPELLASSPEAKSIMVPIDSKIQITFNERIELGTVQSYAKITDSKGDLIKGAWSGQDTIFTFTPSDPFTKLERYDVLIKGAFDSDDNWQGPGVRSISGISMQYDVVFSFSTEGNYGSSPLYLGRGNPDHPSGGRTGIGVLKNFDVTDIGSFEEGGILTLELNSSGGELYIANSAGNTVEVMETASNNIIASISIPDSVETPWFVTFTPDGSEAWILCRGTNHVVIVNTASRNIKTVIPLAKYCADGGFLFAMAINHAGTKGYISTRTGQSVIVIDVRNKTVITNIEKVVEEEQANTIVVSPDDSKILVANFWSTPHFRIIDAASNQVIDNITFAGIPGDGLFPSVVGNYLYLCSRWEGYVIKMDLNDLSIVSKNNTGASMEGIAVDPGGAVVYVTAPAYEDEGAVLILRESDLALLGSIPVGPWRGIVCAKE